MGGFAVSFELTGGYTPDIREVILTGLQTTFSYDVKLRRTAVFWFDRTVASALVAVRVRCDNRYDNLTRLYQISRMRDGRVEETRVVEDEGDVRWALTTFERFPLFSTTALEASAEYTVQVRAQTHPRNTLVRVALGSHRGVRRHEVRVSAVGAGLGRQWADA